MLEPTSTVVLNAIELDVVRAGLVDASGTSLAEGSIAHEPAYERIALTFADPLDTGIHRLALVFRGVLNDRLHGFYRSTYEDAAGRTRVLATTQFEATDARRAFPCWDEPDLKAVFGVTLVVPVEMVAVSCGPVVEDVVIDETGGGFASATPWRCRRISSPSSSEISRQRNQWTSTARRCGFSTPRAKAT